MPSRRNKIAMTEEEANEFIETGWTLQVASNGHNGFPHFVAMWYGVIDGKIHFTTYAKAQKVLNLKRDPRITVMLEAGTEYSKIKGLVIEGEADVIENDPQLVMAVQDATGEKRNPNAAGAVQHPHGQRAAYPTGVQASRRADQPDPRLQLGPREARRRLLDGPNAGCGVPCMQMQPR